MSHKSFWSCIFFAIGLVNSGSMNGQDLEFFRSTNSSPLPLNRLFRLRLIPFTQVTLDVVSEAGRA